MSLFYLSTFATLWSFKKELLYVVLAFLFILMIPVFAVFVLTHTGINVVSDTLVSVDTTEEHTVQLHAPDGSVYAEVTGPFAWPAQGVFTLEFGESSGFQVFHTGLDIASPTGQVGAPITPFMDGEVIYAGEIFWGYGKHIIIDHGNNLTSVYAHLDKIYVFKGQEVKVGDVIGTMGSTGWSTGPHLHFEIRVFGIPVDPRTFLENI